MSKIDRPFKWPFFVALLALQGCTPAYLTVEKNFLKYNDEPLGHSSNKPRVLSDGKAIKVAVAEFSLPNENGGPDYQMARNVNLTQYASEVVNDSIVKAGGSLVDKNDAAKIKEYIQESEKRGGTVDTSSAVDSVGTSNATSCDEPIGKRKHGKKHSKHRKCSALAVPATLEHKETYAGLSDVNYAMLGEISTVGYGQQTSTTQTKDGVLTFCNYNGSVSGTLAVYKIPKTVRENSIRFEASDTSSSEGPCQSDSYNPQIIKSAFEKAIRAVKAEFQNLLAVDTYVLAKRVDRESKKEIFQISAGKNLNLRPGVVMRFMHIDKTSDPMSGQVIDQETMVGQGTVTDKIGANRSWVLVEPADNKGISRWDISRPFHENCTGFTSLCQDK